MKLQAVCKRPECLLFSVDLTLDNFWASLADDRLIILYFSQKVEFDISCKLSPYGDKLH